MNYKTTFVLAVLVAAGAALYWLAPDLSPWLATAHEPRATDTWTLSTLQKALVPDRIERIAVRHGQRLMVLERGPSGEWTLPGRWPARKAEVEELVRLLTSLRSRFTPIPVTDDPADLKSYGLDRPPVTVTVLAAKQSYRLAFGEEPGASNRFSRPTYLRLDDKPEVVRLAPGVVTALDRPQDYYQQRRLFPSERVARDSDSQEKVERLVARSIAAKGPAGSFRLEKEGEEWRLQDPVYDNVDPDKLKTLLTAVPDIWAEQFLDQPKKDLAEYGLKEPERTLRVTRPTGDTTLLIGKQSQTKTRTVTRPAPNFGGPPLPPQREVVHDVYHFAKLQDNDQIFEIKADKLKDLFVAAGSLRDANLARFRSDEARRMEMTRDGEEIVLVKGKDKWVLEKPLSADAEDAKITDVLDKLSGLQAKDSDVIDNADPKTYGLDKPIATIRVTVEEEGKAERTNKLKKAKTFAFTLGKHDTEKSKLYLQVAGRERVNAVEDSILKVVERPALVYRSRRVLDFNSTGLAKIEVRRGKEPFILEQAKDTWRLVTPVQAEVDGSKAGQLAGDLGRLEAVEYVADPAPPDKLGPVYGLGEPSLSAKMVFTDDKKPAQTLLIGKQREGKPEYFAKLESAPGVFVVKREIRDALEQDSLAYRPLRLWQLQVEEIAEVRVRKDGPEYQLKREGQVWKIAGPFEATASADLARPMAEAAAHLSCERYAAHTPAADAHGSPDLATYGLDKPYLRLTVAATQKADGKEQGKNYTLLIGKLTDQAAKSRFAKLEDSPAIFVLGEKTVSALDHGALELLERQLLVLEPETIEQIQRKGAGGRLTLQRKGTEWQVVDSESRAGNASDRSSIDHGARFSADPEAMKAFLGACSNLRAQRYAAYGPRVNLADYGLDKPDVTVTIKQQGAAGGDKHAKPAEHALILGKHAGGAPDERFARLDDRPEVIVLAAGVVSELTHGYLDFVNRSVLHFNASSATSLQRRMGNETLEIIKSEGSWQIVKPAAPGANATGLPSNTTLLADAKTLEELLTELANLRAKRVAAYPVTELASFHLDNPVATLAIRLAVADGKPEEEHLLKIGRAVDDNDPNGDRFAVAGNATTVFVLAGALTRRLTAPPLQFRDHNLARFGDADHIDLERDRRRATFSKEDGTWKLTAPLQAEAEQTELEEFKNAVAHLRADELVAEKPADLKPYGLDRPETRWHFKAGDKALLSLVIGKRERIKDGDREKEGPRCYARLGAGDVVFLLSPQLTEKVEAEYRARAIWPPLDAAQIQRLSYGYGERPFALEKGDSDWHVAGKPNAKVKPDSIRETLDALARLKATRFVIDKAPDLKLYGLEPPQLSLEIQTRNGNRMLQIGRPEGESKRHYARAPEGDKSTVFIANEADALSILKHLPAFVQDAAKVQTTGP
jgi:hypothetical protein